MAKLAQTVGKIIGLGGDSGQTDAINRQTDAFQASQRALMAQNADIQKQSAQYQQDALNQNKITQQQQTVADQLAKDLAKNAQTLNDTNLNAGDVTPVVQPGGTANESDLKRRKARKVNLASTLGIN